MPDATPSPLSSASPVHQLDALVRAWSRPSWDEYFMAMAVLLSSRSSCDRLHVGCVLVSSGDHPNRIIAAGYNGFLPGLPHQSHVRDGHEQATVHAEQNAIADAAKRGVSVMGAIAYLTHFPCINCAKIMAAAGISSVKYLHNYHHDPLVPLLFSQVGVGTEQLAGESSPLFSEDSSATHGRPTCC